MNSPAAVIHRAGGTMKWLQIFAFGWLGIITLGALLAACLMPQIWWVFAPLGVFMGALTAFVLFTRLGLSAQYVALEEAGLRFRLPTLDQTVLLPWRLRPRELAWSEVRAVDLKYRLMVGTEESYILRTGAGDFVFAKPMWPQATELGREIAQRAGVEISVENLSQPAPPGTAFTRGERLMRGAGTVLQWVCLALVALCFLGFAFGQGEGRWACAKAMLYLGIAAAGAEAMRRYRRLR